MAFRCWSLVLFLFKRQLAFFFRLVFECNRLFRRGKQLSGDIKWIKQNIYRLTWCTPFWVYFSLALVYHQVWFHRVLTKSRVSLCMAVQKLQTQTVLPRFLRRFCRRGHGNRHVHNHCFNWLLYNLWNSRRLLRLLQHGCDLVYKHQLIIYWLHFSAWRRSWRQFWVSSTLFYKWSFD